MRRIARAVLALLSLGLPALPLPAEGLRIGVDAAVELALKNNLSLQSTRVDLQTAQRRRDTAWNPLLPSVSARVGVSSPSSQAVAAGDPSWGLSLGAGASLPLTASLPFSIREAALQLEAGRITLKEAESRLRREVSKSFYGLLLSRAKIEEIRENIRTSQANYDLAGRNYEKGLISEIDALSARIELDRLAPQLKEAETAYAVAELELRQSLGLDPGTTLAFEGSIAAAEEPEVEAARIEERIAGRFDLQAARKEIEALENRKRLAAASAFSPSLSLGWSWTRSLEDGSGSSADPGSLSLSLALPLDPWLPASAGRVKLAETEDALKKARIALAQAHQTAEVEVRSLLLQLEKTRASIAALQGMAALAERIYAVREREYEAGLSEQTVVQDALDDLRSARLDLLTERYNRRVALLELDYALGK